MAEDIQHEFRNMRVPPRLPILSDVLYRPLQALTKIMGILRRGDVLRVQQTSIRASCSSSRGGLQM
jgi:hypothetical protein